MGQNEDTSKIVQLPIIVDKRPKQNHNIDSQQILQSKMTITLTLQEILRVKLELWGQVHARLKQEKFKVTKHESIQEEMNEVLKELCKLS